MNTLTATPTEAPESPTPVQCAPHSMTRALRWLGAITLIAAGGSYLVSTWMVASPLTRFYGFLGFTGFLAVAGIFCGMRWREDKGARTFLALSALFVPACTTQLSGLIKAEINQYAVLPRFAVFRIEPIGIPSLLLAVALGMTLLVPACLLAFSALARPEGKRLTLVYLASNAVLLLPFREPNTVAVIVAAMLAFHVFVDRRYFAKCALMKHWDGVAVRCTLGLPIVIQIARTVVMLDTSAALNGVVLAAIGLMFFYGLIRCTSNTALQGTFHVVGLGLFSTAWLQFAQPLVRLLGFSSPEALVPFQILPVSLIVFTLATQVRALHLRKAAGVTAMIALIYHLLAFGGLAPTVLSLAAAVGLVTAAFWFGDRLCLMTGAAGFVITLAHAMFSVREFWAQNLWVSLGCVGVLILLASSLIERNWQLLQQRGVALRTEWDSWN